MRRIAVVVLVIVSACSVTDPGEPEPVALEPGAVGFAFSPPSSDADGFEAFFDRASELGEVVAWVGPWTDLDRVGTVIVEQSAAHGLVPIIVIGFPDGPDGVRQLPSDAAAFAETVAGWVEESPVPLLGIGVETDTAIYEESPDTFDRYVELFDDTADAVHAASPQTRVFPGFQLERLRGLRGGLYGGESGADSWTLLDRFPAADLIGFSTYPGLIFETPSDMPNDYYAEAADRAGRSVIFTEIGWQSGGDLGRWSGSDMAQNEFVSTWAPRIIETSDVAVWSFLWDPVPAPPPFDTMGLIDRDGRERPALATWRGLADR